ncbi:MAG TPA: RHS repeat domain-containing protein, partial [Vicinamibacterales bacterium]|nr:RHS repeat domain-containing protein [Vicinamibacterales bacterium]
MDCDFSRAAPAERRWRLIFALFLLPWAQTSWSAGTGTYAYDDLGRLKSVIYNSGNGIIYKYDDAGNRVTQYTGSIAVFDISAPNVTEGGSVVFTVTRSGNT